MKSARLKNRQAGLAAIEVLVVLGTLGLLAGLVFLFPPRRARSAAPMTACQSNLKQVALAELVWANDNGPKGGTNDLPAADPNIVKRLGSGGIASYYKALSNELIAPRILKCPSENRNYSTNFSSLTASNVSYFLNLSALSSVDAFKVMNGDRYITFTPKPSGQTVTLTANLSMQWTKKMGHGDAGNLALVDGSVHKTSSRDLAKMLLPPSNTVPQRLLFP